MQIPVPRNKHEPEMIIVSVDKEGRPLALYDAKTGKQLDFEIMAPATEREEGDTNGIPTC